jgi:hypothetical protein
MDYRSSIVTGGYSAEAAAKPSASKIVRKLSFNRRTKTDPSEDAQQENSVTNEAPQVGSTGEGGKPHHGAR